MDMVTIHDGVWCLVPFGRVMDGGLVAIFRYPISLFEGAFLIFVAFSTFVAFQNRQSSASTRTRSSTFQPKDYNSS